MSSINKHIVVGNATRDAELVALGTESHVLKFSLATSEYRGKDKDPAVTFHDCVLYGPLATLVKVSKGQLVTVVGPNRKRQYEKDGRKVTVSEIIVAEIAVAGKSEQSAAPRREAKAGSATPTDAGFEDDDCPF